MADEDIGALAVMHQGRLIGIFSERDYARKLVLLGRTSQETTVAEAMTMPPTCVPPDETVESCMRIMVMNRSRHLFVREGGQLLGLVSVGDLVNWTISAQAETIHQLSTYIAGGYPG
jgi:CBS domain-containing protein